MMKESKKQVSSFWGAIIMFWLLVVVVLGTSIPLMLGMAVVALVPGVGELRSRDPWLLLHFLWIFPLFWLSCMVVEAVLKFLFRTRESKIFQEILENLVLWLLLSLLYTIFFRDPLGALMAGLLSRVFLKPFADWLEKHAPKDDDDPSGGGAGEEGASE
jgi:putative membrane protein